MSFSANSNICVWSGLISIDWLFSSLWVVLSCLFACLGIFDWLPDIVNFTLLSLGYFVFFQSSEHCSGMLLNYLGTVILVLLLWFIRWIQSRAQSRALLFLILRAGGNRHCFQLLWVPGTVLANPADVCPLTLVSFLTGKSWSMLCWTLKGDPLHISGLSLCAVFSSLIQTIIAWNRGNGKLTIRQRLWSGTWEENWSVRQQCSEHGPWPAPAKAEKEMRTFRDLPKSLTEWLCVSWIG